MNKSGRRIKPYLEQSDAWMLYAVSQQEKKRKIHAVVQKSK